MQKARNRPDPVSCQSCRSKKLKCNRVHPCSNCTARRIACSFLVPPEKHHPVTSETLSNAELLRRIERLEAVVLRQSGPAGIDPARQSDVTTTSRIASSEIEKARDEDLHLLEHAAVREDSLVCH